MLQETPENDPTTTDDLNQLTPPTNIPLLDQITSAKPNKDHQKPEEPTSAEIQQDLAEKRIAVFSATGDRIELTANDLLEVINELPKIKGHPGVFYRELTDLFYDKEVEVRKTPRQVEAEKTLAQLVGRDAPEGNNEWFVAKSGHDVRVALNTMLDTLQQAGFVELKAWMPMDKLAYGVLTDFQSQEKNAYLTVTPAGKKHLG